MLEKPYKIISYYKNNVIKFMIIDENTGEVISDANGYGFKSKISALSYYLRYIKNNSFTKMKK